jgi:hypothetical protein
VRLALPKDARLAVLIPRLRELLEEWAAEDAAARRQLVLDAATQEFTSGEWITQYAGPTGASPLRATVPKAVARKLEALTRDKRIMERLSRRDVPTGRDDKLQLLVAGLAALGAAWYGTGYAASEVQAQLRTSRTRKPG